MERRDPDHSALTKPGEPKAARSLERFNAPLDDIVDMPDETVEHLAPQFDTATIFHEARHPPRVIAAARFRAG